MNQYREEPEGEWEIDPLKPDGTSAPLVKENTALRARVRELEGAVEAARASAIREAVAALPRSPLFSGVDMVSIEGWHIHRHELLATLLPAPAPGRDTAGPGTTAGSGTTTGGNDAA